MLEEHHNYKVDVFSLGILFHAILECEFKDYDHDRCYGVFIYTRNRQREPIGIQMHEEGGDLKVPFQGRRRRLIERMLKYNPSQRPTAEEVKNVLRSRWRRWFQLV